MVTQRAVQAERFRYRHMDMAHLDEQLHAARHARRRLVATDGVFSMDGDVAPLGEIVALARKHDAQVFVDECHATGIVGPTGRGTDEACGVLGQVCAVPPLPPPLALVPLSVHHRHTKKPKQSPSIRMSAL